ncbi:MAG: hypothetical protein ACE5GM_09105 [bacterium]
MINKRYLFIILSGLIVLMIAGAAEVTAAPGEQSLKDLLISASQGGRADLKALDKFKPATADDINALFEFIGRGNLNSPRYRGGDQRRCQRWQPTGPIRLSCRPEAPESLDRHHFSKDVR